MSIDIRIIAEWFNIDLEQLPKEENLQEEPTTPASPSDGDETAPSR